MPRWLDLWRSKIVPKPTGVVEVRSIFGPLLAFAGDFATRQIEQFGAHTRNEVALLRSFIAPGDLIYDVGAHIGTFAIPLALATGESGHVIAIEADAENFALLRRNIDRLGLQKRITPLHGLAGGRDGGYRRIHSTGHTSATYFLPDPNGVTLPAVVLDELQGAAPRRVAIIKIDVEGMELAVLRSAERTIARDRTVLYVEISIAQMARYGIALSAVADFLTPRNYRCFRNVGDRNSNDDGFQLRELSDLHDGGEFYDLLAVPAERVPMFASLAPFARR